MRLCRGLLLAVSLIATGDTVWADTNSGPGAGGTPPPKARGESQMDRPLEIRLTAPMVDQFFPEADGIASIDGDPPIATVTGNGETVGYVFSTHETVRPTGYAGESFDIMVALGIDGIIRGHRMLEHHEPLIGRHKLSGTHLDEFLSELHGLDLLTVQRFRPINYDGVSRATVSAEAMRRATTAAAITVGQLKGLVSEDRSGLWLDRFSFAEYTWDELVEEGSIRSLSLTNKDIQETFSQNGSGSSLSDDIVEPGNTPAITLYTALVTPPSIGRNLFGFKVFRQMSRDIESGEYQLMIVSSGKYRWLPKNPWKEEIFDGIRIVQNGNIIPLRSENFYAVYRLRINGNPDFDQGGWFRIPSDTNFDPVQEWTLEVSISPETPSGLSTQSALLSLPYKIPPHYVMGTTSALEDAGFKEAEYIGIGNWRVSTLTDWQRTWIDKQWSIVGLILLLTATSLIMLLSHRLARSKQLHRTLRILVLGITLLWLGWIAGTQLTILSVINYVTIALRGANWDSVLFDPLLVILTGYVLITLVLWGRGLFCGWLCPFGALQELLAKIATFLRVPQVNVRHSIQNKAWILKYVLVTGIIGLTFYSTHWATQAAEVEPFKTAITLRFDRSWPYVFYAFLLLSLGLFIERFYCRYLCPLGAMLAIAGRFHFFNRLKRRPECGNPCHLCERSCPIGAIAPTGSINMNECLQCLDCQVEYYDDTRCPPLAQLKKTKPHPFDMGIAST